jgi:hypothetical protein
VFHHPLLLARANERRRRCTWLRELFGFNQKQFAFSQFQKWLAALIIGAPA